MERETESKVKPDETEAEQRVEDLDVTEETADAVKGGANEDEDLDDLEIQR
jgi:hypothetical protein